MLNKTNTKLNIISILKINQVKEYFKSPCYKNFVYSINLNTKYLLPFITSKSNKFKIKIIDSTPLEVCKIQRERRHKVCRFLSSKSYNGIYWYYLCFVYKMLMSGVSGLKLHILIEPNGSIIDAKITTARIHDSKIHSLFIPKYPNMISKQLTKKDIKSYSRIRKKVANPPFLFLKVNIILFLLYLDL